MIDFFICKSIFFELKYNFLCLEKIVQKSVLLYVKINIAGVKVVCALNASRGVRTSKQMMNIPNDRKYSK